MKILLCTCRDAGRKAFLRNCKELIVVHQVMLKVFLVVFGLCGIVIK